MPHLISADEIVVGMLVTSKEPHRSRADFSKASWGAYFEAVHGFTFDFAAHAPWVQHVDKAFPEEGTGRGNGLALAMLPELLAMQPRGKWYFLADDDTFVVPHQLLQAALGMDHRKPILAGRCGIVRYGGSTAEDLEFIVGGGGILASRGMVETLAPRAQACRRTYNFHDYGDTRVAACGLEVFKHTAVFLACRQSEFFIDGPLEAVPSHQILPGKKVITMHLKDLMLYKLLFRYLESDMAKGRDILWEDVARVAGLLKAGVH